VDIEKDATKEQAFENQVSGAVEQFKKLLGLDQEAAAKLVGSGISGPLELVAGGVEAGDLVTMLGIDEAAAAEIIEKAQALAGAKTAPAAATE
jgi:hypothetical protein